MESSTGVELQLKCSCKFEGKNRKGAKQKDSTVTTYDKIMFGVNIALGIVIFIVEVVIGYLHHSVTLVSDALHMLADVISIILGLVFLIKSATSKKMLDDGFDPFTYGFDRYNIIGAMCNGLFLIAFSITIATDSLTKLFDPEPITEPHIVLYAGIVSAIANIITFLFFHVGLRKGENKLEHWHHCHDRNTGCDDGGVDFLNQNDASRHNRQLGSSTDKCQGHNHILCHEHTYEHCNDEVNHINPNHCHDHSNDSEEEDPKVDHECNCVQDPSIREPEANEANIINLSKTKSSKRENIYAVYLHVIGDLFGSILVIVMASLKMNVVGRWVDYIDPVLSLILATSMMVVGFKQLRRNIPTLLQKSPEAGNNSQILYLIQKRFPDIQSIHQYHLWHFANASYVCTMHIIVSRDINSQKLLRELTSFLNKNGVDNATIQVEKAKTTNKDDSPPHEEGPLSDNTIPYQ